MPLETGLHGEESGGADGGPPSAPEPDLDLDDIQGNILRGYRAQEAHHLLLEFPDARCGRSFIQALLPENASPTSLTISHARFETPPPTYCLNLGFTFAGLQALGLTEAQLDGFLPAFREGAARRAHKTMDVGGSAPSGWAFGREDEAVHAVASLSFRCPEPGFMPTTLDLLRRMLGGHGIRLAPRQPPIGQALPEDTIHFGFREGMGQPWIRGFPGQRNFPNQLPDSPPGDFILGRGYVGSLLRNYLGDIDPRLGDNATYGAFRMMRQDAWGFEEYLQRTSRRIGQPADWLAAKLVGRWRNGASLMGAPEVEPSSPESSGLDDFDYVRPPGPVGDPRGEMCPIGAHSRRMNPRNQRVHGGNALARRIIRRAMPFGPPLKNDSGPDGEERGIVGYFFCGSLEEQFEFQVGTWGNKDLFTPGIRDTLDPFVGAHSPGPGRFVIPTAGDPIVLEDLPQFVTIGGGLNCFIPGISGLRFMSSGAG